VSLDKIYRSEQGEPWASVFTPALTAALDAVLGDDRYSEVRVCVCVCVISLDEGKVAHLSLCFVQVRQGWLRLWLVDDHVPPCVAFARKWIQ
jgi:hypothetical protein